MTLFEKGRPKTGGRTKGAKNRLSHAFLTALAEDFEQHGIEALKIARIERPVEYIKVVAGLRGLLATTRPPVNRRPRSLVSGVLSK